MVNFKSNKKYHVALCFYDSINHILNFSDWKLFFGNVAKLLDDNGVFILDVNTTDRLSKIAKMPAYFSEFDNNYFYMKRKQQKKGQQFILH